MWLGMGVSRVMVFWDNWHPFGHLHHRYDNCFKACLGKYLSAKVECGFAIILELLKVGRTRTEFDDLRLTKTIFRI